MDKFWCPKKGIWKPLAAWTPAFCRGCWDKKTCWIYPRLLKEIKIEKKERENNG